jgi:inosine-uridine nucleoside N-ribohydrolase
MFRKKIFVISVLFFLIYNSYASNVKPVPVIFDTDIGSDFDDMWALVMLLNSPELDVKLITTSTGDAAYRAKVVAKVLEIAGRTDIPIGIGSSKAKGDVCFRQYQWVDGYDLAKYPGKIYQNGAMVMVETIINSSQKIKLISVGPTPTIEAALDIDPNIAKNAEFIGMQGSISNTKINEYNVARWIPGMKKVLAADWKKTITPLDTCGDIILDGDRYNKFQGRHSKLTDAIIEAYGQWYKTQNWIDPEKINPSISSSILYDTVAVYLALNSDLLQIDELALEINDTGGTIVNQKDGRPVQAAIKWKDKQAFLDLLLERIIK